MATKCFHPQCDKKLPEDSLFRINAKGQPGIWACIDHIKHSDKKIDPIVKQLVFLFEEGKQDDLDAERFGNRNCLGRPALAQRVGLQTVAMQNLKA